MKQERFEILFAEIPFPSLVIRSDNHEIITGNRKFEIFSGLIIEEIAGQNISFILPGFQSKNPDQLKETLAAGNQPILLDKKSYLFHRNNQDNKSVLVKCYFLPQDESKILVIIEPDSSVNNTLQSISSAEFWRAMEAIIRAANEDDLSTMLSRILSISQQITGAGQIVIYKMSEDQPTLKIWASTNQPIMFPDLLNAQELASLSSAQIWKPGKRTENIIQRYARQEKLNYVATAPLGESHAMIGLILFAGTTPATSFLLSFVQYLSVLLSSILERHTWRKNIEKDLEAFQIQVNTSNTIEERISDGLLLLTNNLEITRINSAAEAILGYNEREVKNQSVLKILIGAESINQALKNAQNSSATFSLGENIRLYRRNGEAFQAVIRIFPILLDREVQKILVLIQDLSEQEFIKQQAQQLEQRAFLGEVTATFAHEIRNPVHNISTGLQLMAYKMPKDDPRQQDIECMIQDCDRLAELIKSVLAFSKPIDYEMENVDLDHMLRHLLERLHARITRSKVEYDLQISPELPSVYGNMHALEQVINNLVSNALQAMEPEGGRLVIKAQPTQTPEGRQLIEISIADTGHGIPRENQERIFQPFYTTKKKGTGLGLAVSKRILTAHKGTIRLTSFPGGTIFHIQLPASKIQ